MSKKLFGTDGIRGRANVWPVTPEIALRVGRALAMLYKASGDGHHKIVIGKDTRVSGYMLETALTSGLVAGGMDVLMVGPMPTPAVAHLVRSLTADAGIMLTASHNPYTDNGIKLFDGQGYKLTDEQEEEITRLVLDETIVWPSVDKVGKAKRINDASGRYIEFAKATVQNESLNGIKVVLDCANGAAYDIAPKVFEELGAKLETISNRPDGYNINADCGAMHPEVMGARVWETKADIGVALDGDADRLILCDHRGTVVDGDRVLAMCAFDMMEKGKLKNDTLVITSMSNLGLHHALQKKGIKVEITDVGDRYVIDAMRSKGFNLGGEKSGHVILHDYVTTGDGIITALQIIRLMHATGLRLSDLADCMEEYPQKLVGLKVREKKPIESVPILADTIKACEKALEGIGRTVVRYSGTEPKIRLLVEAQDEKLVNEWINRLTDAVREGLEVV